MSNEWSSVNRALVRVLCRIKFMHFHYWQSVTDKKSLRRNSKALEAGSNGSWVDGGALGMERTAVDEKVELGLFHWDRVVRNVEGMRIRVSLIKHWGSWTGADWSKRRHVH